MIDVTANVHAEATATEAWELISDFEGEWEPSNPEHKGTEVLTKPKQPLRDGLRWWQREGVGPLTGELTAIVHDTRPERAFSWTGEAIYKPFGMCVRVKEGGDFRIEPKGDGVRLVHRVWGEFPKGIVGWVIERVIGTLLRFRSAAYRHTLVELEYFAGRLEGSIARGERR